MLDVLSIFIEFDSCFGFTVGFNPVMSITILLLCCLRNKKRGLQSPRVGNEIKCYLYLSYSFGESADCKNCMGCRLVACQSKQSVCSLFRVVEGC